MNSNFDDIRPYNDNEINPAMRRLACNSNLGLVVSNFFPEFSMQEMQEMITGINDVESFQMKIMLPVIQSIISSTITSFTISGFENLPAEAACLYISNHRDILLDASLLQISLVTNGRKTSGITFGSNLMQDDFGLDIGKSNKMFKVERSGTNAQIYNHSKHLSEYIRHSIVNNNESIWIAQRNGRTKDGIDKTETGVIKMFSMSGTDDFLASFTELKITPMSISYEYEPCDLLKAQELYHKEVNGSYIKTPGEDYNSIVTGIMQPKGRVHIAFSKPVSHAALEIISESCPKNRIKELAAIIDLNINSNYKLWNTNYIAHDLLTGKDSFSENYTPEEKEGFIDYMEKKLATADNDNEKLREIFLSIYANPVTNRK